MSLPSHVATVPEPRKSNLNTAWQRKWIALDATDKMLLDLGDTAESFCSRFYRNTTRQSLLVLSGVTGCGKSHTAKAIFKFCTAACSRSFEEGHWGDKKRPSTVFIRWPEAASEFANKRDYLMEDMFEHDLVVLDDVGAENDPWKICADKLCQVLTRRESKFTVVTTNVPPTEWSAKFDVRIADRFMRNSVIADLTGVPSYATRG